MSNLLGVDLGGTKCAVARGGEDGHLETVERFPTTGREETLERLLETVAALEPGADPVFGVACGGPLDAPAGLILSPANLPDWDRVPITRLLTERFGGTAYLMNDANAGALAEWRWGAGQGCRSLIFLTHGTGFGAGLVLDGRLYEGATGAAGEIGHVRLEPEGPAGWGKAGAVEGFCSGGGIARWAELRGLPYGTAQEVVAAAEQGEAATVQLLADSGRQLGRALAILVDVLNPEVIVLGSLYQRAGRFLEAEMRAALAAEALPGPLGACRIVGSALGEEIGSHAALAVALYRTGRLS